MSENDPWKKVGTYAADICLDDGDLIDVDVCLRTEVDAARAAEATQHQQEIAELEQRHADELAAVRSSQQLIDQIATLRAERDRLKAALETLVRAVSMVVSFAQSWQPLTPGDIKEMRQANDAARAALSGEGTAKP